MNKNNTVDKSGSKGFYRLMAIGLVVFCVELLLLWPGGAFAAEADYAEPWCERMGGRSEVVLADRSRVDCLLVGHAVEVDFARKWAEAMGQALHYARMTGKLPGIMLILEKPGDERYVARLYADADAYGIPLFIWTVPVVDYQAGLSDGKAE
jgi:hypothetical protein